MKNEKLNLPDVTLIAVSSVKMKQTIKALKYSMRGIRWGEVVLVSHKKPWYLPQNIHYKKIDELKCIDDFNHAMIFELYKYVDTKFAMLVHHDGFVVNPECWKEEFLEYDYIGSPWPNPTDEKTYRDIYGNVHRVGNSVSIRSKKLMEMPSKLSMPWENITCEKNEDTYICCNYRHIFEKNGICYAPLDVAKYFAHERNIPEVRGIKAFAFHKYEGDNAKYPYFKPSYYERFKQKMALLLHK